MAKPAPHHAGTFGNQSRKLRATANRTPFTTCARCGMTLAELRARNPGKRIVWCAGHVNRGEVNGKLRPECSICSAREGQRVTSAILRARPKRRRRSIGRTSIVW